MKNHKLLGTVATETAQVYYRLILQYSRNSIGHIHMCILYFNLLHHIIVEAGLAIMTKKLRKLTAELTQEI